MYEGVCAAPDCAATQLMGRGLCGRCYQRWKKGMIPGLNPASRRVTNRCSLEGCDRPCSGRGLCRMHYMRWRRTGSTRSNREVPREERFWAKVDKVGPISSFRPDLGRCWIWTAALSKDGYGHFHYENGLLAHRYAYELLVGPIPSDLVPDHLCRVRCCVNPQHLELVTRRENTIRGHKARGTYRAPA